MTMITIFTTPKPMQGRDKINQHNAISSWLAMPQKPQVIVFAEEKERSLFEGMGTTVISTHRRNDKNTPFLDSMFNLAEVNALYPYVMYVNADVVLFSDIYTATRLAAEHCPEFLIMGQRTDIEWCSKMDFSNVMWKTGLQHYAKSTGTLVNPTGKDYFIFAKPFSVRMAALLVGRLGWDTWLVREAHRKRLPLMDATPTITALHIKHNYEHLAGGRAEYAMGPGCHWNYKILGTQESTIAGRIDDAPLVITPDGVRERTQCLEAS